MDAGALARLRELDPDGRHGVVPRVLSAFENSLTRALAQLAGLRTAPDAEVVAGLAHKLKSGAASVGALELARDCADVERRLRAGDHAHLSADIERLLTAGEGALAATGSILRP